MRRGRRYRGLLSCSAAQWDEPRTSGRFGAVRDPARLAMVSARAPRPVVFSGIAPELAISSPRAECPRSLPNVGPNFGCVRRFNETLLGVPIEEPPKYARDPNEKHRGMKRLRKEFVEHPCFDQFGGPN